MPAGQLRHPFFEIAREHGVRPRCREWLLASCFLFCMIPLGSHVITKSTRGDTLEVQHQIGLIYRANGREWKATLPRQDAVRVM